MIIVNDPDFKSFAKGVVIPHGLYDVQLDKAMINIGSVQRVISGSVGAIGFNMIAYT